MSITKNGGVSKIKFKYFIINLHRTWILYGAQIVIEFIIL